MLLSNTVNIKWYNKTKKYYESKGYVFTKYGEYFEVKVEDLLKGSNVEVNVQCDYCGKIMNKNYADYLDGRITIEKDCCKECRPIKFKEVFFILHGIDNPFKDKDIKNKIKQNNLDKYGCEYVSSSEIVKEKRKNTFINKYNCENPFQNAEIKEKIKQTNIEKYGVEYPSQNEEIRNKITNSFLDKYGVESPLQNIEIKEKVKNTCLERYGCESPTQNDNIKEKIKQTNLKRYGVECVLLNDDIKRKRDNTCIEKYGTKYLSQNEDIKKKIIKTNQDKYGTDHPLQNEIIKNKLIQTNLIKYGCEYSVQSELVKEKIKISLYQNGTCPTSSQQLYIYSLFKENNYNVELNYPISRTNVDIAFIDEMIYLEYDGGGHNLAVKFGQKSEEEFNTKEIKRYYALLKYGWKEIKLISRKDYLPVNKNLILDMFSFAKNYLNNGHSWIYFDIDNQIVKCNQFKINYNFGKLFKYKNNNISKSEVI